MLENVKVVDKVVIHNGEIGEVVNVGINNVDIVANWCGVATITHQQEA